MKTLVVISGKGGAGKTSLTAALASLAEKTVLADCDVDAADLHLVLNPTVHKEHSFVSGEYASIDPLLCLECGQCAEDCKYGAIRETAGRYEVVEHACEGCGMCEFVCPAKAVSMLPRRCGAWYESTTRFGTMIHAALDIGGENSGKLVTTVRKAAEKAAEKEQAEIVLVDGPPGIGCPVIASLTGADTVILAAEAGMAAVHDLKRAVELLHHFKIPAVAVINKAGVNPAMGNGTSRVLRCQQYSGCRRDSLQHGHYRSATQQQSHYRTRPGRSWADIPRYVAKYTVNST